MKKAIKLFVIGSLILSSFLTDSNAKAQVRASVNISLFQTTLSPHGRWVNHPGYGQVWIYNKPGWRPYYNDGHWVYTDDGWTWVSDYDWGWAPFHYGRWAYESSYGWYWVPGYEWGPAWVNWRSGGDYYGWTPLSPGVSISVGFGRSVPDNQWVFAPRRYIASPQINRYYVDNSRNTTIIHNTTVINRAHPSRYNGNNRTYVVSGPSRTDVERTTKTKVDVVKINNSSSPGKTVVNNKTVNIYRPEINKNTTIDNSKTVNNVNSNNKNSNNTTKVNNKNSGNTTDKSTTVNNKNSNNTKVNKSSSSSEVNKSTDVNKKTSVQNSNNKPAAPKQANDNKPANDAVKKNDNVNLDNNKAPKVNDGNQPLRNNATNRQNANKQVQPANERKAPVAARQAQKPNRQPNAGKGKPDNKPRQNR